MSKKAGEDEATGDCSLRPCCSELYTLITEGSPSLPPTNEVWGKVIFLHLFVILFTGGSAWAGTSPGRYTPQDQVHPQGSGTAPGTRYPPDQVPPWTRYTPPRPGTPPDQVHPLDQVHPPGSSACWEIWATSGWYASYWNAFLLFFILLLKTTIRRS